jgi:hypothetical protein
LVAAVAFGKVIDASPGMGVGTLYTAWDVSLVVE